MACIKNTANQASEALGHAIMVTRETEKITEPDSAAARAADEQMRLAAMAALADHVAVSLRDAGRLDGIGFCFMDDDPFAGIDLDDCRDPETGEIMEDAMAIINIADSYTEVSPSSRGVKIFLKGHHPNGNNATFISSPFNQTSANPKLT